MKKIFVCLILLCAGAAYSKTITDMYGNKVDVPERITKIFSLTRSLTPMLYTLAPDLLAAVNTQIGDPLPGGYRNDSSSVGFYSKRYLSLPAIGGSSATGTILNQEVLLAVKPDVIFSWGGDSGIDKKTEAAIKRLGFPIVKVDISGMAHYADTFLFLGKLLGREERGKELAAYANKAVANVKAAVAKVPKNKRLVVYYARGGNGLNSACVDSWHAELIPLAGGINPVRCLTGHYTGMELINIEQILLMQPDVIIALQPSVAKAIRGSSVWNNVNAVKNNRIYTIPGVPMNWFDGPPSFVGILGLQWLAGKLYPDYYHIDIAAETGRFMKLYYMKDLTQKEIKDILRE